MIIHGLILQSFYNKHVFTGQNLQMNEGPYLLNILQAYNRRHKNVLFR